MIIKNIQGLRGVAVLLVILFHLNHQTFFFGFVGVDIFFIISGFVITKSIFKNLNSKNYEVNDILKFYSKRILRIMPALFVMIILSITFIILFSVLSRETITFINTGLFSLIAISNFYLMNIKTDYFQEDVNPFLHTWSLGVEEQFYLIFPLLIFFTYKFNIKKILPILTFFFLISFCLFISTNMNFFNPFIRFWEIIFGSILFLLKKNNLKIKKDIVIILLLSTLFFFDKESYKPIILIASLITASCLVTNFSVDVTNRILSSKILFFLGNISYSLYLWHLPIIYITKQYFVSYAQNLLAIALTIIMATLSYYLVEVRFKNNEKAILLLQKKILNKKILITLLIFFSISFISIDTFNLKKTLIQKHHNNVGKLLNNVNISSKILLNEKINYEEISRECHEKYHSLSNINEKCYKKKYSNNLVILFGDSHAHHFTPAFQQLNIDYDTLISTYNLSSFHYNMISGEKPHQILMDRIKKLNKKYKKIYLFLSFSHLKARERMNKTFYDKQTKNYLNFFSTMPKNTEVIIIKDTPIFLYNYNQCLLKKKLTGENFIEACNLSVHKFNQQQYELNYLIEKLKLKNKSFKIFDINYLICNKNKCNFYYENVPVSLDGSHLSKNFSTKLSKNFVEFIKSLDF